MPFSVLVVYQMLLDEVPTSESLLHGHFVIKVLVEVGMSHYVLGLHPPVAVSIGLSFIQKSLVYHAAVGRQSFIGSGSDVAVESADVILMKDSIHDVVTAIRLSKAVIRNIHQNLFWAFFYNSIGIPVAAGVLYAFGGPLLSPVFAGAAMAFSSVCVVTNALRLKRFRA